MPVLRRILLLRAVAARAVAARAVAARAVAAGAAAAGTLTVAAITGPAVSASIAAPDAGKAAVTVRGAAGPVSDCLTLASPTCYSPEQFRTAYGIQPLINRGITGRGETVVLPEIAAAPGQAGVTDVRQDLARYDSTFCLPAASLKVITALAPGAAPFQAPTEYSGDVEIVHAIAPRAAIRVILIPAGVISDLALAAKDVTAALRVAPSLGGVVALTQAGRNENCYTSSAQISAEHSALEFDQGRHVTVVASSGDFGAIGIPCTSTPTPPPVRGVAFPAGDPLVLDAGGTSLDASHVTGAYAGETAWNRPVPGLPQAVASSGGFSRVFARPAYQDGIPGIGAHRGGPDVSSDAGEGTGIAFVEAAGDEFGVFSAVGTSAASPAWAGIVALADQYAGRHLGFINPAIYQIGRSARYHRAFHDVTRGNNTVKSGSVTVKGFDATRGWDPVTGWGSPDAQVLIPLLARYVAR